MRLSPDDTVTMGLGITEGVEEGTLRLKEWTDREGKQRTGLDVAAWKVERLGEIGRNKPPKAKKPPEGENSAPPSTHDWQRPPADDAIPF